MAQFKYDKKAQMEINEKQIWNRWEETVFHAENAKLL